MNVILATRNKSKARQISAIFSNSLINLFTLDEVGIEGEGVEDGTTLAENALKKARYAHERSSPKTWVVADDTGLSIDFLKGAPGIKAARWAGETASTTEITQHTLKMMRGAKDRTATFETVVAAIAPNGAEYLFTGTCKGWILEKQRVPPQPQMPYSGIFIPDAAEEVWAQMKTDRENSISHRGIAFRQALAFLVSQM